MQNHPSNNNVRQAGSGTQDLDILSAIEAAAAEEYEETTPGSSAEKPAQQSKETKKLDTDKTVKHLHRDEICEKEYDAILNQAIEDREAMLARKKKMRRIATAAVFLITCGSAAGWYAASPDNQAKVHGLWNGAVAITEDVKEGTDVVAIMDKYDAALEKIDERQETITDAAIQLGVDPDSVTAEDDARLDEAMKTVTGDAPTVAQRDALLKKRFAKMGEQARKDIEAKRAEQQAQNK